MPRATRAAAHVGRVALDPVRIQELLTSVGFIWIMFGGRAKQVMEFDSRDWEEMKENRQTNKNVTAVKKAMQIMEIAEKLERDLEACANWSGPANEASRTPGAERAPAVTAPTVPRPPRADALALVPISNSIRIVEMTPTTAPFPGSDWPQYFIGLLNFVDTYKSQYSNAMKPYIFMVRACLWAIYMAPLMLAYAGIFYLMSMIYCIAYNPGLLVKAAFAVADLIPNYAGQFATSIAEQVKVELSTRMR